MYTAVCLQNNYSCQCDFLFDIKRIRICNENSFVKYILTRGKVQQDLKTNRRHNVSNMELGEQTQWGQLTHSWQTAHPLCLWQSWCQLLSPTFVINTTSSLSVMCPNLGFRNCDLLILVIVPTLCFPYLCTTP